MKRRWRKLFHKERTEDCFDPQGSYTGVPADKTEKPIQDADDL